MTKIVFFAETPRGAWMEDFTRLFHGQAQSGVEIDVPGLVLVVIGDITTIIEIVAGCRLDIDTEIRGQIKLYARAGQCRELYAVLVDAEAIGLARFLEGRLDIEVCLHTTDGIDA